MQYSDKYIAIIKAGLINIQVQKHSAIYSK